MLLLPLSFSFIHLENQSTEHKNAEVQNTKHSVEEKNRLLGCQKTFHFSSLFMVNTMHYTLA